MDNLTHHLLTVEGASIPLVQLQDPLPTRGPGVLVVTDEQRVDLWSGANREHYRLQRGAWYEKGWARIGVAAVVLSSLLGGAASVYTLVAHK